MFINLYKNGQQVQVPLDNGGQTARRGRNIALLTRRNMVGFAMMARGNAQQSQTRQTIMQYIQDGYRPDPNDMQTKQILTQMGIAYQ